MYFVIPYVEAGHGCIPLNREDDPERSGRLEAGEIIEPYAGSGGLNLKSRVLAESGSTWFLMLVATSDVFASRPS